VEAVTCRLLPYAVADGPTNMAADEALVRTAAADGVASLRFYGWQPATLSLGYIQPAAARLSDPLLTPLPWVRRPSGGATLVHHHEVTYALALPAGAPWQTGASWMPRMHRILAQALDEVVPTGAVTPVEGTAVRHGDVLCFQQYTPGDLLSAGKKVVGSAQRKYHRSLLQHGSILLVRSEHTPALPGLKELTGAAPSVGAVCEAVARAFERDTGWRLEASDWTERERRDTAELIAEKYDSPRWNEKR
jgi:lipoate-protein ligase A